MYFAWCFLICLILNDQELPTLMRRFKDGDTYLYPEMCDLFSHVYQQHSSMTGSQPVEKVLVASYSTLIALHDM